VAPDDGRLEIKPFHWSGKNSELERRKAGNDLRRQMPAPATTTLRPGPSPGRPPHPASAAAAVSSSSVRRSICTPLSRPH